MACAGLAFGLLSIALAALSWFGMPPCYVLTCVCAVALGHMAVGRMNRSLVRVSGFAMARLGMSLGYGVGILFPLGTLVAVPAASKIAQKSDQAEAVKNCGMIIVTLRLYSSDCAGNYPDNDHLPHPTTANGAFRECFRNGVCYDEKIFTCSLSPFHPDGEIGSAPKFNKALERGENHWALSKGLSDSASGFYPLVYENPVTIVDGLPEWNADDAGKPTPGRCWPGGKVIIGFNDSSVAFLPLEKATGKSVGLALDPIRGEIFGAMADGHLGILDVER